MRCSGFGRDDRIREPSPAASTIAETVMLEVLAHRFRGEGSNPYMQDQNLLSYH